MSKLQLRFIVNALLAKVKQQRRALSALHAVNADPDCPEHCLGSYPRCDQLACARGAAKDPLRPHFIPDFERKKGPVAC